MPETTEKYHRIPVTPKKEGDRIRTIIISKKDGIKALYAGNRKVILTYFFDVNKWTMAKAKEWVRTHTKPATKEKKVEDYKIEKSIPIKKYDKMKKIVYGEVYVPDEVDTQGDFMSKEEIEKMAHRFLMECRQMDQEHNEIPGVAVPVESFIAREGDPDFKEGAWVLAVKVLDEELWGRIMSGEITGYSFQGYANAETVEG